MGTLCKISNAQNSLGFWILVIRVSLQHLISARSCSVFEVMTLPLIKTVLRLMKLLDLKLFSAMFSDVKYLKR